MTFLLDANNTPFIISLTMLILLAIIELIALFSGFGVLQWLNKINIHHDMDGAHVEAGIVTELLNWMKLNQLPFAIVFVLMLMSFSVIGFTIQLIAYQLTRLTISEFFAIIIVIILMCPLMRLLIPIFVYILPNEKTDVVSLDSFIGRQAVIILGEAREGFSAQAKVKDEHNRSHYVMVEPDIKGDVFKENDKVLLVKRNKSIFLAIT
jgi:Inner membrane protein YqiJ, OB-fold/Inner membrane protein YqiJ, N-terminal